MPLSATRLRIVTTGPLAPLGLSAIDHIALSPELEAQAITALDHRGGSGRLISDHFGVAARVGHRMP
jgi:endonuclease/exonuclease/phosphatase family metal-dependent hydrolase